MKKKVIKAIISDFGNVLAVSHKDRAAKKFSKLNGLSVKENMKIMKDDAAYMKGNITPYNFAKKHIKHFNLNINEKEFYNIYVDIFTLNKPLFKLLKKLKKKVNLVMLSNMENPTGEFITRKFNSLFKIFKNKIIFSYNVHLIKPQKEIYLLALKAVESKPENALFIDDRIENIKAARRLGINSIHYKSFKDLVKKLKEYKF